MTRPTPTDANGRLTPRRTRAAGFTLLELVVSLVIAGVLLATTTSAIVLATKALPSDDSPAAQTATAAASLQQLRDDLRAAVHLTSRTTTSVTLTLADRDADGLPEVITYAWAGTSGDPVTRAVNGASATPVLDGVDAFSLAYVTTDAVQAYPGAQSDSAEQLFSSDTEYNNQAGVKVTTDDWIGFRFSPSLPAGAGSWRVTRASVIGRTAGASNGIARFELTGLAGDEPDGNVHDYADLVESDMDANHIYREVSFSAGGTFASGDSAAITIKPAPGNGGQSGDFRYDNSSDIQNLHTTQNAGGIWQNTGAWKSMPHYVYGTYATSGDDWTLTRQRVNAIDVALTLNANTGQTHHTRVNLPNQPVAADDLWEARFGADPTLLDLDDNTTADWGDTGTFDASRLTADGTWHVTGTVSAQPQTPSFNTPLTLDLWLRDTTDDGSGGGVNVRCDRAGGTLGHFNIKVEMVGSVQRVTVNGETAVGGNETWVQTDVDTTGNVHVHAAIDSDLDAVAIAVDGTHLGGFAYERSTDANAAGFAFSADTTNSGVYLDRVRVLTGGTLAYASAGTLASVGDDLSLSLTVGGVGASANPGSAASSSTSSAPSTPDTSSSKSSSDFWSDLFNR